MFKKIILIIGGCILLGGGLFIISTSIREHNSKDISYSDNYQSYTSNRVDPNKNTILFFKADWCTTCSALDKNIQDNITTIPENTQILVVDYDTNTSLRNTYSVVVQHTIVHIDENNDEINKSIGDRTLTEVLNNRQV